MPSSSFQGSADITVEGIKKHFKKFEASQAIIELIWNGLDANAICIDVNIQTNDFGGLKLIEVVDNGDGIDFNNLDNNFNRFNESLKNEIGQHGSHGRGRLAFHKLSSKATWFTKHNAENASIAIESSNIKNYRGSLLDDGEQNSNLISLNSGTCVCLENFINDLPEIEKFLDILAVEFGWYLALNENVSIYLNNKEYKVEIPNHDFIESEVEIEGTKFKLNFLRWHNKPTSEQSYYYLLNSQGKTVHKQLSSFNKKSLFWLSAFAKSGWADTFVAGEPDLFTDIECTIESKTYKKLLKVINKESQFIYDAYLRSFVDCQLDKYTEEGAFPSYEGENADYAEWKLKNTISLVKQIYLADPGLFNTLNKKQRKIVIRLLDKLTVSDHNNSLFNVLESVLDLEPQKMKQLSEQINRSRLEHIISTIDVLHRRENTIHQLKEVMRNHYKDILETPDLQLIIENNTWLFGSQYETLGAEEDDFVSITRNLRERIKGINEVSEEDVEELESIEGIRRQVDLFLARRIPKTDYDGSKYFHCVVVEIKRPGVALNYNHMAQLERYADILAKTPDFSGENTRIDLILVGRKLSNTDTTIRGRLETCLDKQEPGLVRSGRIKCFVKTWQTIFEEFELANEYLLTRLETKKDDLSEFNTANLIEKLQTKAK